MLGTISIKDQKISCIIGILPLERISPQDIFVDVDIECDFEKVSASGSLNATLDYFQISLFLKSWFVGQKFELLETAAEKTSAALLTKYVTALRCLVRVKKPGAIPDAAWASVSLERSRSDLMN